MKLAIVSKIVHSPDFKTFSRTWEFIENGNSQHEVEIEFVCNATKAVMVQDIVQGNFGSKPHIYKWLNRPTKVVKGKTNIKRNYKVL